MDQMNGRKMRFAKKMKTAGIPAAGFGFDGAGASDVDLRGGRRSYADWRRCGIGCEYAQFDRLIKMVYNCLKAV